MIKEILGSAAVVLAVVSFVPYYRDIFARRTRPHSFTWLVWGILTSSAFVAQVTHDAGPGAWATALTSVLTLGVFVLSLSRGESNITRADCVGLGGAALAGVAWWATSNPTIAITLIVLIDTFGFFPTFRKSWHSPEAETLSHYNIGIAKHLLATLALTEFTYINALYPLTAAAMDVALVWMILLRRKSINALD